MNLNFFRGQRAFRKDPDLRPQISCDGQEVFSTKAGDEIVIRKSASSLKLIHPLEHSFYGACRSKLGWGNRLEKED